MLNYLAAPFMLLTWRDSILGWSRLAWYGHWMVVSALVFFYGGGTRVLRHLQIARAKAAGVRVEGTDGGKTNGSVSGATTPRVQTMPPLDDVAQEVEKTEFMRNLSN